MAESKTVKDYLVIYNVMSFLLWAFALFSALVIPERYEPFHIFQATKHTLRLTTTAALLEVIHALFRFTRNDPFTVAVQVLSRLQLVWVVWILAPRTQSHWGAVAVVIAWCCSEIIRYPYYICQSAGIKPPHLCKALRYSGFLVLYPAGILGEVLCMLEATREFASFKPVPSPMPNRLNFEVSLRFIYQILLLCYIPGSVHMYGHMINQRSKARKSAKAL